MQEEGVEGMASHKCAPAASARSGSVGEIEVAERFGSATSICLLLGPHPSVSRLVAYVFTFAHMWLVCFKLLAWHHSVNGVAERLTPECVGAGDSFRGSVSVSQSNDMG